MYTLQETFDKVVAHARKQNKKAVDKIKEGAFPTCLYRLEKHGEKLMCFAGCLLPDEKYDPKFEGHGLVFVEDVIDSTETTEIVEIFSNLGYDVEFLIELQNIHDHSPVDYWESEFEDLAKRYSLEYKPKI